LAFDAYASLLAVKGLATKTDAFPDRKQEQEKPQKRHENRLILSGIFQTTFC